MRKYSIYYEHKASLGARDDGLYIAKQIAEAHGGTIRAESEGRDKGSTFFVELPTS
ncbi:MAG: ATP-binding protein [Candidatus Paceibacterota bacterium]|jgi:signal transduction histidine kinase